MSNPVEDQGTPRSFGKEPRRCWICLEEELVEEEHESLWVAPCECTGGGKWVHQACLLQWVDELGQGNDHTVPCPSCKYVYVVKYRDWGSQRDWWLDKGLMVRLRWRKMCENSILAGVVFSAYVLAKTYGEYVVGEFAGLEGKMYLDREPATWGAWCVRKIGIPSIPFGLGASSMLYGRLFSHGKNSSGGMVTHVVSSLLLPKISKDVGAYLPLSTTLEKSWVGSAVVLSLCVSFSMYIKSEWKRRKIRRFVEYGRKWS